MSSLDNIKGKGRDGGGEQGYVKGNRIIPGMGI